MPYWTLKLSDGTPGLFGSVPPLAEEIGVKNYIIERIFSRLKKTEAEINGYRIVKLEIRKSKR